MKFILKNILLICVFFTICQSISYGSSKTTSYEAYITENFSDNYNLDLEKLIISLIDYNIRRKVEKNDVRRVGNWKNTKLIYKSYFSKPRNKALAICVNDNYFIKFNSNAVILGKHHSFGSYWGDTSTQSAKKEALNTCFNNQKSHCKCKVVAVNDEYLLTDTDKQNFFKSNDVILSSLPYSYNKKFLTKPKIKPLISSEEFQKERNKRLELQRKLAALEHKQKQEQQRIDTDTRVPLLEIISNKTKGKRGTITGIARDNVKVAEVTIDGKPVSLSVNGDFQYSTFVPSDGVTLNVQVTDVAGLTSSKTVSLKRNDSFASTAISFDRLNPLGKRVKTNSNALALIVGVEGYKNTNANALYADSDAKMFRDYATEKLGIPESRIKTLINGKATEQEILLSVKEWLHRSAKPNKSDIYVFFAGHGLASQDGKNMYLLPHDGSPRLLGDTAILRDRLFDDLKATNPKSVTVFLDTCYSGVTRNEEMLIAGRPIVIKAKEQAIPDGFTLFSAASNEQISRPLEEAKHGMFSYFLMKGMEGDADTNNDNNITARELHAYVEQNVVQQSSGSQTPELQGDKDRVLVKFN